MRKFTCQILKKYVTLLTLNPLFSNVILFDWTFSECALPACFKDATTLLQSRSLVLRKMFLNSNPYRFWVPLLSKLLETGILVVKNWTLSYLRVMNESQVAHVSFPGRGTSSALALLQHHVLQVFDRDFRAVRLMTVDFSKSFDGLPHETIVQAVTAFQLSSPLAQDRQYHGKSLPRCENLITFADDCCVRLFPLRAFFESRNPTLCNRSTLRRPATQCSLQKQHFHCYFQSI